MDLILEYADYYALDAVYPADMPRDSISRQIASITGITLVGGICSTSLVPALRTSSGSTRS